MSPALTATGGSVGGGGSEKAYEKSYCKIIEMLHIIVKSEVNIVLVYFQGTQPHL